MYINIIIKDMDNFSVLKSEKFNVGKIQKQRINITNKIKGKPLKQKDIKEIVNQINAKYIRDNNKLLKYWYAECMKSECGLSKVMRIRLTQCLMMKMIISRDVLQILVVSNNLTK